MKKKIFISGPIQGVETNQSYRDAIRQTCISYGFEVIDPWEREKSCMEEQRKDGGIKCQLPVS